MTKGEVETSVKPDHPLVRARRPTEPVSAEVRPLSPKPPASLDVSYARDTVGCGRVFSIVFYFNRCLSVNIIDVNNKLTETKCNNGRIIVWLADVIFGKCPVLARQRVTFN